MNEVLARAPPLVPGSCNHAEAIRGVCPLARREAVASRATGAQNVLPDSGQMRQVGGAACGGLFSDRRPPLLSTRLTKSVNAVHEITIMPGSAASVGALEIEAR